MAIMKIRLNLKPADSYHELAQVDAELRCHMRMPTGNPR